MDNVPPSHHIGQVEELPPGATETDGRSKNCPASEPSRLWLWIVAAFVAQALAWTAWFVIAAHNKVEEVPLATERRR